MKNIVLLSDGTGNGAAKRHKTNVWRLYQALDLDDPDKQLAFYDDGVGTQQFLPFKLLSGAFGWGLQRNVLELYMALCRTFEEGDKVYLFGFSRGAFTVRMLAGLIACRGLTKYKNEDDLRRAARKQFIAYRSRYERGYVHRFWRVLSRRIDQRGLNERTVHPEIEFIGAWDTVDAYGFPVYELVWLWDRLIWPLRFADQKLSPKVRRACQALSIDDERASFWPVLWNECESARDERRDADCSRGKDSADGGSRTNIEQVWFAGVHADVGGGYPRSELALVTLDWMISKVEARSRYASGLRFVSKLRKDYSRRANCQGVQHDSRSGVRAYYRYKPRNIAKLCREQGATPKVHCSVLERVRKKIAAYAPTALPREPSVVDSQDKETNDDRTYDVGEMEMARAFVRRRRWLYAAFVMATLTFLLLPLFLPGTTGGSCSGWTCVAGIPFRLAACFLPDCVQPWVAGWIGLVENPWGLTWIAVTALVLRQLKAKWFLATRGHAIAAWVGSEEEE